MTQAKLVGELLNETYPERPEILGPWLRVANLVLLYAPRGIGKTFFALWLAHAIATRSKFLKWTPLQERKVVLFDGEMGFQPLQQRLIEIDASNQNSIRGNMLSIMSFETFGSTMPNLSTKEGQKVYTEALKGHDIAIIDNLLSCSAPESSRDDDVRMWGRIQEWAIRMRQQGKTILFIHHAGKSGAQLGTSQRENVMDTIVALHRPKRAEMMNGFEADLKFEKARNFYGKEAEPIYIRLDHTETGSRWSWTTMDDKLKLDVLHYSQRGMKDHEIAKHLNIPVFQVKEYLSTDNTHWSDGYEHDTEF